MTDDIFDFGFTAVDETELEIVQKAQSDLTDLNHTAEDAQGKLDRLYNAITPLLSNLKANPEKEYILWPNRTEKIDQFEQKLFDIYNG
jgi:peptidoglycan hydrolase CwlO-like protein